MRIKRPSVTRYHDFSMGHRVCGHESKCRHLHGHNYRVHFTCEAKELDSVGRVIDFGVIKEKLCNWLEENWDHKFMHHADDPVIHLMLQGANKADEWNEEMQHLCESLVGVNFNPTAENMAQYLVEVVGPKQLAGTDVTLVSVVIEETAKCSAAYGV